MKSAIYKGWVRHRRFTPTQHALRYQVFMLLLDLDELDFVFDSSKWWSTTSWAPARFKREDYLGDPAIPLDQAVRMLVQQRTGHYPEGKIQLLTNLRYFGFIMNPISCYYCFDKNDELQFVIAEVNNTPWDERYCYVLPCEPKQYYQRINFQKELHVSPFNPMDVRYHWRCNPPDQTLRINMQNWRGPQHHQVKEFDATLVLNRQALTGDSLRKTITRQPLMTVKVVAAIYWEALKLFIKKTPLFNHPKNINR